MESCWSHQGLWFRHLWDYDIAKYRQRKIWSKIANSVKNIDKKGGATHSDNLSWTSMASDCDWTVWAWKPELPDRCGLFFTLHRSSCNAENHKSQEVFRTLRAIFARHKIPEKVRSDDDLQCASTDFVNAWGFRQKTSSPCFLQSNGEVEHAVKNCQVTSQ